VHVAIDVKRIAVCSSNRRIWNLSNILQTFWVI